MHWCCYQCRTSDISSEEANLEQAFEELKISKPEKSGVSDLDIREWNIELRENDLKLEEQNVIKKEINIERHSLEKKRSIEKANYDLNLREIEIERELRTLTEKKQEDILTNKLHEIIILKMSFDLKDDIEISYRVFEKTEKDKNIKNIKKLECLMPDPKKNLNKDENSGLGKDTLHQNKRPSLRHKNTFRDCP